MLLGAVCGRVAFGVLPVAVFLAFLHTTDSIRSAALLSAAHGLVGAASFPLKGRLVDRRGRFALYAMGAAALSVTAACLLAQGVAALFVVLVAASVLSPPVTSTVRSSLSSRMSGELSETAFALDAGLEEAAFLVGPAIGGFAVAALGARQGLVAAAMLLTVAVAVLAPLQPKTRRTSSVRPQRARLTPGTRYIAGIFTAGALAQGLIAATIAAAARNLHSDSLYGVLLSLDGVGALIGLALFSKLRLPLHRSIPVMSALTVVLALPLLAVQSTVPLLIAVTMLGLPVASLAAALNSGVAAVERPERRNEAFAVLVTCQNLAGAAGFAAGGAVVGLLGRTGPIALAIAIAGFAFCLLVPSTSRRLSAASGGATER